MSKQVNIDKRKGLVRVTKAEDVAVFEIKFDREIDDKSLWYVLINDGTITTTTVCKLTSITERFNKQTKMWNVKVLGCWRNNNGRDYIKF